LGRCRVVYIPGPTAVPRGHDMYMTYRKDEKLSMGIHHKSLVVNTIHERQGHKGKSVCLIRLKVNDLEIYRSNPHLIVALRRTEEDFTYYTVDSSDKLSTWIRRGQIQDFMPPEELKFVQKNYRHLGGALTIREEKFFRIRNPEVAELEEQWMSMLAHVGPLSGAITEPWIWTVARPIQVRWRPEDVGGILLH
jgi:hypothetical protein